MAQGWDFDPSAFSAKISDEVGKRLRIISMALLTEVVTRSPVDTGRFRANNQVSLGAPDYASTESTDASGAQTIQQGSAVIAQGMPYSVIFIQNNLPYAESLENGHSKQAPTGVYANSFHGVSQAYK